MLHTRISCFALFFLAACLQAIEPGDPTILDTGRAWITATTATWQAAAAADTKVWNGIRADAGKRMVEVTAVGTGPQSNGLLEFLLVSESGKAYESVAVTTAKPSEIADALAFIGVPRGQPVDFAAMLYWPKGERIRVSLVSVAADGTRGKPLSIGDLVRDGKKADATNDTFVFVGRDRKNADGSSDTDQTGEIITMFSSPFTVLDVPDQTPQGERYGSLTVAANEALRQDAHLIFQLTPEYGPDKRRVKDLSLTVLPGPAAGSLQFELKIAGEAESRKLELQAFLQVVQQLIQDGHDPWLELHFGPDLPLSLAADFARMMDVAASRALLRISPSANEPFYQALLPDPAWRDRNNRPAQPIEIHATPKGDDWSGTLIRPELERTDDGWNVKTAEFPFASLADLLKLVADDTGNDALFYYLPADLPYRQLLALYGHFKDRWRTQYVLLDAAP